ncbi:hypothetical protein DID88_000687 [Monilinia fructigena]|uniref:DUF7729 domain-containing protein n=1 Tax=Monilinia fructigena TaxID=38457 RepID=A0A395IIN8_9HELO|nr:hypothetical protein DID88_000687 [Monilinia fructigena]
MELDPSLVRASLSDSAPKSWEISNRVIEEKENDHPDLNSNLGVELEFEFELFQKANSESDVESNLESNVGKRNIATITSTATITPPKSTSTASPTSSSTLASSDTSSGLASAATGSTSSLPTLFDSGFTSNITSTCSSFMMDFLANETFKSCLPFSLLLQNSNSFFQASKSLVRITQTLDASCSANQQECSTLMTSLASNITSPSACSTDLLAANPLVTQARLGLLAYTTLFTASCLKDSSNGAYCYAQAVTNSSSPTDSYIYYLPLNVSLPGGSQPTCNECLKTTMAVFEQAGSVRTSAIAGTYIQAAGQINVQCGPGFVNASLPAATVLTGAAHRPYLDGGYECAPQDHNRSRNHNTGLRHWEHEMGNWLPGETPHKHNAARPNRPNSRLNEEEARAGHSQYTTQYASTQHLTNTNAVHSDAEMKQKVTPTRKYPFINPSPRNLHNQDATSALASAPALEKVDGGTQRMHKA